MRRDIPDGVVGRAPELAVFGRLVTDLAAGRGRCVLVEGEPGIGKSTLMATGLAHAGNAYCAVSRGACDELGQKFPLSVLLTTLNANHDSAGPAPVETGSGPAARGWSVALVSGDPVLAAIERLLAVVDRMCADGPLVLALDDLQWADDATLLVWRQLARATAQLPLLLVATCRPLPRPAELDRLRRDMQTRDGVLIPLQRLTPAEVAQIVHKLTGGAPGPGLAGRLELAAGNPLYVREMLDALSRSDILKVTGEAVELADHRADGQPLRLSDARGGVSLAVAIADRLDFLSTASREVLRTAALLGPDFSVTDLSNILGRPAAALAEALEEALAAGVLEPIGARLKFRHGLLKQALYEAMPVSLRIALHRDAARAQMEAGSPVERVAELILAALEAADGWELDWLVDNAAGLTHRSPASAAELFENALLHTDQDDPRRAVLEDHLAAVAFLLAHYEQAEQTARRTLDTLDRRPGPERRGQAVWSLGYTLLRTGRRGDALTLVADARADPRISALWRARLGALNAVVILAGGQLAQAGQAADLALADGERLADPMTIGYALHTAAMTRYAANDMAGCVELIDQALAVIGSDPQLADLRLLLQSNQISALCGLDRLTTAAATLREARALAERTGTARLIGFVIHSSEMAHHLGAWDDALAELDTIADSAHPTYSNLLPVLIHGITALIAVHRDDQQTAAQHLNAVSGDGKDVPYSTNNAVHLFKARAMFAERSGQPDEATAVLKVLLQPKYDVMDDRASLLPILVRLALQTGDVPTARDAAAIAAAEARDGPLPRAIAAADWCRGLCEGDPTAILEAADYYHSSGRRIQHANALEDAATVLAQTGDSAAARTALTDAMAIYADLGAVWDSRRATTRLRPLGIRLGVRGVRRRPQTGWPALTETERRVADMVAGGRSNPDIAAHLLLSRRTVETHVSHILAKLQAHSRREIAELAETAGAAASRE